MMVVNWTDHQLAEKIKRYKLNHEKQTSGNCYYYSDNYKMEIIVIFNNSDNTRTIIYNLK